MLRPFYKYTVGVNIVTSRSKMQEFLTLASANLKSENYSTLNLILGNESCDLDSAVASIVYANFLHWQHYQLQCKVCTRNKRETASKQDIFVPILNVDREDFELKTEVEMCLTENKIRKDMLVFRNDYNLEELVTKTKTNVILVDHHVLAKKDKFLAPFVTEIVDHRPIDKTEWTYRDDTRSTIETVGSCCTLVAQRIRDLSTLVSKELIFYDSFPICPQLLHSTIILDTVNFSKEVNKATAHDVEVVSYLESIIKPENVGKEREEKLTRLLQARTDVSKLTAGQLLKKDAKIVDYIYVPSFPILVEEFLSKPGALAAVSEALIKNGCSVALLLGMSLRNNLRRDVAIRGSDADKAGQLAKFLQDWPKPSLQLSKVDAVTDCQYFRQLNLGASRKQYMPAINEFIRTLQ